MPLGAFRIAAGVFATPALDADEIAYPVAAGRISSFPPPGAAAPPPDDELAWLHDDDLDDAAPQDGALSPQPGADADGWSVRPVTGLALVN